MQPEGPQALTVTRYLVDGVRPDSTPAGGQERIQGGGRDRKKSAEKASKRLILEKINLI